MSQFAKQQRQQQRMKNRRSKQNSPGVDYSSPNNQQYSERILNIPFSSLPSMHLGDVDPLIAMVEGVLSRSCPSPNLTSPLKVPTPSGKGPLSNPAKRKFFAPHWSDQAVEEAIEKGNAFRATFRVNAYNGQEAYCTIDGVPVDVLINGIVAQNRAVDGDVVAITLDPVAYWTKLKGSNVPLSPVVSDDSTSASEVREIGENCANQERMAANGLLGMGSEYNENGSTSESMNAYLDNRSEITHTMSDGHKFTVAGCSNAGCSPKQDDDAARALARVCAMVNSCPSKRPTGKVVSILRKSSRRGAVIGFLSTEGEHGTKTNELKRKKQILPYDYVQLLPTDTKFPKMVVSVSSLPDLEKERLFNGDVNLERELIAAQIEEWSDEFPLPKAHVIHILGRGGEIETQIAAILFQNAISDSNFSPETLGCIPNIPCEVPEKEFETRKDLRNICTFTIDPSAATELDDALSVEILSDEIFRIGVHIADVSYFVIPDTALDAEARIRSTSIYIRQHRFSMLPRELSEGMCSLLPGADRLAFSVTWDVTCSGQIVNRWFGRSVIQSCCKLSYELVQEIIDDSFVPKHCNSYGSSNPKLHGHFEWKDVISSLKSLYEISLCLRKNRFEDGALWLDSSKLGFLFDECGTPCDIFLHEMKGPCFLVEEFMLLANMSVAQVISMAFPDCALLRRHPEPSLRKLRDFDAFCSKHGFDLDTSSSRQFHLSLSKIREELKDDPVLFDILVSYASKPMQSAAYFCTGELKGRENDWAHYALSVPFYTHFTSPIRRYPDIIVHRTLSAVLDAEEEYLKKRNLLPCIYQKEASSSEFFTRCFTGLYFNKEAAESNDGREILTSAALKFKVPRCDELSEVAAYCNDRKLASRRAEEAGDKLFLWALLKKKEVLVCEARVLGLGPRFMSVYIHKFGIERRINYDEVEGLSVEWLDATCTLVLDLLRSKKFQRRVYNSKKLRPIEGTALVVHPSEESGGGAEKKETSPAIFPLILRSLSAVPIALHAVGGDDGPIDIGVRLYMCSYFR